MIVLINFPVTHSGLVHIHAYLYIHTYMHTKHTYVHNAWIHTYVHLFIITCIYVHMQECVLTKNTHPYTKYTLTNKQSHTYTDRNEHTQVNKHKGTHAQTSTTKKQLFQN